MNTKSDLYATRELFSEYINYTAPLSYEEWLSAADDLKAAVLYCQFFEQITLAWYKLKSVYSTEADGVAEVLQYLQKNVSNIKADSNKFSPAYIYRVVYNCLYCLCRDPNRYKAAYENECSNIQMSSDGEFDLFDTYVDPNHSIESELASVERERIWNVIESRGRKTVIVVAELIGEEYDWTDKNADLPKADEPWRMKWKKHKCKVDKYAWNTIHAHAKYPAGTEGYTEIISEAYLGDDKYQIEYREYVKDSYKGAKKFSKADHDSVSEEERAEILDFLKTIFGEYRQSFAFQILRYLTDDRAD